MTKEDLRFKRNLLGLTYSELARLIGVTKQTICNIETGKTPISKPIEIALEVAISNKFIELSHEELIKNIYKI